MNSKTTMGMLAAVLVLLLLLLMVGGEDVSENGGGSGPLFADFGEPDVTELSWVAGHDEVSVSRVEGSEEDWVVHVAGAKVPAAGSVVEEVLSEISRCTVKSTIPAADVTATNRQEYGLDPETAHLRIVMRGEESRAIFGLSGLSRDTVYAARDGSDDVLLVRDDLLETLREMVIGKVRETKFTDLSVYEVGEVAVATPEGVRFAAARDEGDSTIWSATVPFAGELDPTGMEGDFLPVILRTEAAEFAADAVADEDLPKYGLGAPRYRITIVERGGDSTRTLLIGADVPEREGVVWFMAEGEPFVFASNLEDLVEQLERDPAELRDRNLTRLGLKVVAKVTAELDGEGFEMVKEGEGWRLDEPVKMDLDLDAVEAWREKVRSLQIVEFLPDPDLEALGLAEPRGVLTFWGAAKEDDHSHAHDPDAEMSGEREIVARILVGGPAGDDRSSYALREGDASTAFVVGPSLIGLMEGGHFRFKARDVFAVDLGSREVTGLLRRVGEEDLEAKKEGGAWPEGINANSIAPLVRTLLALRAVRWVGRAEGHEEDYGIGAEPHLRLEISLRKRDEPEAEPLAYGVVVGAETAGGRYARAIREGVPGADVFVISAADLDEDHLGKSVRIVPAKDDAEDGAKDTPEDAPKDGAGEGADVKDPGGAGGGDDEEK